jgi:hypothetical protein
MSDVSVPSSKELTNNQYEIKDNNNVFIKRSPTSNSLIKSHPMKSTEIVRFKRNKLEKINKEEFKN